MDVKSTWILTWHPMDHVSWSLGLFSQPICWRETMALPTLTTVGLCYFIMCEDPRESELIGIAFG
jgi:hypothetical protein